MELKEKQEKKCWQDVILEKNSVQYHLGGKEEKNPRELLHNAMTRLII